jgi:hypothetical protein
MTSCFTKAPSAIRPYIDSLVMVPKDPSRGPQHRPSHRWHQDDLGVHVVASRDAGEDGKVPAVV